MVQSAITCRLQAGSAVFPKRPLACGHFTRFVALPTRKPLALPVKLPRQGVASVGRCSWKHALISVACQAESVTTENQASSNTPNEGGSPQKSQGRTSEERPLEEIVVGETYEGTVAGVTKFGCFVEFGFAKQALIHISELAVEFIEDTSTVVTRGETIKFAVLDVDVEKQRIKGSIKRLLQAEKAALSTSGDTGEESRQEKSFQKGSKRNPKKIPFKVGEEVTGTVYKVHGWGAFFDLPGGFSGLLHISEMTDVKTDSADPDSLPNAADYITEGDDVAVRIREVKDSKISLTQRSQEDIAQEEQARKGGLAAIPEEEFPDVFKIKFVLEGIEPSQFGALPEGVSLSYDEEDAAPNAKEQASTSSDAVEDTREVEEPKSEPEEAEPVEAVAKTEEATPVVAQAEESKSSSSEAAVISAKLVKQLREISGAGMMDCKKALTEANGDIAEAEAALKKKGIATAAKKSGRIAAEGAIGAYIHNGSQLGVLIEVNCETDFVARGPIFKELVENLAMQVAASTEAVCVSVDDFPTDILEKERQIELAKEDLQSKPEAIREKMVEGRLQKMRATSALLEQAYVRDTEKTVKEAVTDAISTLGENISIRRFERFNLGEGLEKRSTDFAAEVAEQTQKKESAPEPVKEEPPKEESTESEADVSNVQVSAEDVKTLRAQTGAGMMDCKKALQESGGDMEEAAKSLKVKGMASADKKAGRIAAEGAIGSYIHTGSRLGVIAEINCETDFVARGEIFKQLVEDMCMQVAASPDVQYVKEEDIPKEVLDKEREIELGKEDLQGKPEEVREKMVEGRLKKYSKTLSLMDQPYVKDNDKTVGDALREAVASIGENIQIRRFTRFNLGEGMEKRSDDFAAEVAAQTGGI